MPSLRAKITIENKEDGSRCKCIDVETSTVVKFCWPIENSKQYLSG